LQALFEIIDREKLTVSGHLFGRYEKGILK